MSSTINEFKFVLISPETRRAFYDKHKARLKLSTYQYFSYEIKEATKAADTLYLKLADKGLYMDTYTAFIESHTNEMAINKLHAMLIENGFYSSSRQAFYLKFFPEILNKR
ncbi:hypothetical protein [Mucilaginibacter koreensis]